MSIKNDYLLDMIAQFVDSLVEGFGRARAGAEDDALTTYEAVVGRVLDMDPTVALGLSPTSLVTMMQLSAVDESLATYAVWSMVAAADIHEAEDDGLAGLRRAQAQAVADAYGFPVATVPPELSEALAAAGEARDDA